MNMKFWTTLSQAVFHESVSTPNFEQSGYLPSNFAVSDFLAESVALTGAALARLRDQPTEVVDVDGRLCAYWSANSGIPLGWSLPNPWDALSTSYRGKDGYIRLHTNAAHHKAAAIAALGTSDDFDVVQKAISGRNVQELEDSIVKAGGAAAQMMSPSVWNIHPQGSAVALEPVVHWKQRDAKAPERLREQRYKSDRPLHEIRILDLTRVLAGPVATRTLAGFGASVLRIDPANWTDSGVLHDTTLGKRCAELDLRNPVDQQNFESLLEQADLLIHGYRPGALAALGFDDDRLARINPSLIDISLNAYGWSGPWRDRRGFDSLVQFSSGIADICRGDQEEPGKLPVQALDHASGYLLAACALEALNRARMSGQIMSAKTSLARMSTLLQSAGFNNQCNPRIAPLEDKDYNVQIETSSWGKLRRLNAPLKVDGATMHWSLPSGKLRRHSAEWHSDQSPSA